MKRHAAWAALAFAGLAVEYYALRTKKIAPLTETAGKAMGFGKFYQPLGTGIYIGTAAWFAIHIARFFEESAKTLLVAMEDSIEHLADLADDE